VSAEQQNTVRRGPEREGSGFKGKKKRKAMMPHSGGYKKLPDGMWGIENFKQRLEPLKGTRKVRGSKKK